MFVFFKDRISCKLFVVENGVTHGRRWTTTIFLSSQYVLTWCWNMIMIFSNGGDAQIDAQSNEHIPSRWIFHWAKLKSQYCRSWAIKTDRQRDTMGQNLPYNHPCCHGSSIKSPNNGFKITKVPIHMSYRLEIKSWLIDFNTCLLINSSCSPLKSFLFDKSDWKCHSRLHLQIMVIETCLQPFLLTTSCLSQKQISMTEHAQKTPALRKTNEHIYENNLNI